MKSEQQYLSQWVFEIRNISLLNVVLIHLIPTLDFIESIMSHTLSILIFYVKIFFIFAHENRNKLF